MTDLDIDVNVNVVAPEVPGIPKNELLWVQGYNAEGALHHVITSTKLRDRYFLYLMKDGRIEKKLKENSPEKFRKYTDSVN